MDSNYHEAKFLTKAQQENLLTACKNLKYRLIILLMLDCGLRVTEVVSLKIKHFNFLQNYVEVDSLKKQKKTEVRRVHLTQRLLDTIANYLHTLKNYTSECYIFPAVSSQNLSGHLSRKQVWRKVKKLTGNAVYPHILRHTFASRIVNEGNELRTAQKLLGHSSSKTTEIYTHITEEQGRVAIASIERESLLQRWQRRFFPRKTIPLMPVEHGITKFHVGRKKEITQLRDLAGKKVNTIIFGPQGIGKTHILDNFQADNILRIDDMHRPKTILGGMLLELFNGDKEAIADALFKDQEIDKIITRESAKRLVELLMQVTQPLEYTLIIDDVGTITKSGVGVLEKLNKHFHIICAARKLKIDYGTFLSNFQRIELKPLSRPESLQLIQKTSRPFRQRIENYEAYKNHIFENTNGNPLSIIEMTQRYQKEPDITLEIIKDIRHTTALNEIDMSLPIVIFLSSLMVLRYVGGEVGEDAGAFRLIGGGFLVFALFARNLFRAGRRKFV